MHDCCYDLPSQRHYLMGSFSTSGPKMGYRLSFPVKLETRTFFPFCFLHSVISEKKEATLCSCKQCLQGVMAKTPVANFGHTFAHWLRIYYGVRGFPHLRSLTGIEAEGEIQGCREGYEPARILYSLHRTPAEHLDLSATLLIKKPEDSFFLCSPVLKSVQ